MPSAKPDSRWGVVTAGWPSRRNCTVGWWRRGVLLRVLLIGFLIAHGLVHIAIWAPKYDPEKVAFDASHSWLIGDQRTLARVLAFGAAALLVVAGIGLWAQAGWWRPTAAVVGLGVSTVLILLYFNRWYLLIVAVNIALIVGIAFMDWPSKTTVGGWAERQGVLVTLQTKAPIASPTLLACPRNQWLPLSRLTSALPGCGPPPRRTDRRQRVVSGVDNQRRDGSKGNRSAARFETNPSKTAPLATRLEENIPAATASASRGLGV
jgi:hypothetical protein